MRLEFRSSEAWKATPLLRLCPDTTWAVVVVPGKVPSTGQRDLFKNYLIKHLLIFVLIICIRHVKCMCAYVCVNVCVHLWVYIYIYIFVPTHPWGGEHLVKELMVTTRLMQNSSNELSTSVSECAKCKQTKVNMYAVNSQELTLSRRLVGYVISLT